MPQIRISHTLMPLELSSFSTTLTKWVLSMVGHRICSPNAGASSQFSSSVTWLQPVTLCLLASNFLFLPWPSSLILFLHLSSLLFLSSSSPTEWESLSGTWFRNTLFHIARFLFLTLSIDEVFWPPSLGPAVPQIQGPVLILGKKYLNNTSVMCWGSASPPVLTF